MNADKILFRCSSLGHLMTDPKSKSELISETTKTHLIDVFVSAKYGRREDIANKFTNKGLMVEEDSLTLFTQFDKKLHMKNKDWLTNDFISGTPDIVNTDEVIDIKSSFSIYTFFRTKSKPMNKMYYWQLQGYMALTGKTKARLAYCLINTPEVIVNDEKRRLAWKSGILTDDHPDLQEAFNEIERLHNYDDIPISERVIVYDVARNDEDIERLYQRVKDCRNWMNLNLFKP